MTTWPKLSLILLALTGLLMTFNPAIYLTVFDDYNYHLLTAQNFVRAGGVTTTNFWTSLPETRANLYPPLFHLLLAPAVQLDLAPATILTYTPILFLLISLLISWLGMRLLFGDRAAFFFLLLTLAFEKYFSLSSLLGPATLVLALAPLCLYLITRKKFLASGILIAAMLYTQMFIPWAVIAALGLWGLIARKHFRTVVWSILIGIGLAIPWISHYVSNSILIKYFNPQHTGNTLGIPSIEMHLFSWILLAGALFYLLRRTGQKPQITFFALLIVTQLPLLLTNLPIRFWAGGGYFAAIILIAVWLAEICQNKRNWVITIILILLIGSPIIETKMNPYRYELNWRSSVITGSAYDLFLKNQTALEDLPYSAENLHLAEAIINNSDPDDIIYSQSIRIGLREYADANITAQFFASLTGRAIGNRLDPESQLYPPFPIEKAKILIVDYHDTSLFPRTKNDPTDFSRFIDERFNFVRQEDRTAVYVNKNAEATFKLTPAKPVIPLYLAYLLILTALAWIWRETRRSMTS